MYVSAVSGQLFADTFQGGIQRYCLECAGRRLGKPKPNWSWIWCRMSKTNGRLAKMWAHCLTIQEAWLHRTWKRLRLDVFFTSVFTGFQESLLQGNPRKSPEQGRYTFGGRGLGQGILKQSRYTLSSWSWMRCWGSWHMSLQGHSV